MAESLTGKAIDPFTATTAKLHAWLRDNGAQHIVDQTTEERTLRVAVVRRIRLCSASSASLTSHRSC